MAAAASARILGAAVTMVGDLNPDRLAHAKQVGFEPIDLSAHDRLGELVAEILGVPEVDCAIDCVGFEAKGQGSDGHAVEAPAVVLNGLMEITRPAGSIGIPGLYVTDDPGARTKAARRRLSLRFGLGWSKSHLSAHRADPGAEVQPTADAGNPVGPTPDRRDRQRQGDQLDQAPEGYRNFDAGVPNKSVIDPHGLMPENSLALPKRSGVEGDVGITRTRLIANFAHPIGGQCIDH